MSASIDHYVAVLTFNSFLVVQFKICHFLDPYQCLKPYHISVLNAAEGARGVAACAVARKLCVCVKRGGALGGECATVGTEASVEHPPPPPALGRGVTVSMCLKGPRCSTLRCLIAGIASIHSTPSFLVLCCRRHAIRPSRPCCLGLARQRESVLHDVFATTHWSDFPRRV